LSNLSCEAFYCSYAYTDAVDNTDRDAYTDDGIVPGPPHLRA
jgi:hypothetical protein